mgnify:CR=1 FL=1
MDGARISTTASLGIAGFPRDVSTVEDVLDKADLALYRSKKSGRNRVTHYDVSLEAVPAFA